MCPIGHANHVSDLVPGLDLVHAELYSCNVVRMSLVYIIHLDVSRALVIPWTICGVTPGQTFASLLCAGPIELFVEF